MEAERGRAPPTPQRCPTSSPSRSPRRWCPLHRGVLGGVLGRVPLALSAPPGLPLSPQPWQQRREGKGRGRAGSSAGRGRGGGPGGAARRLGAAPGEPRRLRGARWRRGKLPERGSGPVPSRPLLSHPVPSRPDPTRRCSPWGSSRSTSVTTARPRSHRRRGRGLRARLHRVSPLLLLLLLLLSLLPVSPTPRPRSAVGGGGSGARVQLRLRRGQLLPGHRRPPHRPRRPPLRLLHVWPPAARALLHRQPPPGEPPDGGVGCPGTGRRHRATPGAPRAPTGRGTRRGRGRVWGSPPGA